MLLTKVSVEKFKSIDESGEVTIDPEVTVLVGQNEAGKTAFLQAMHKASSVDGAKYNVTEDYPRKWFTEYQKKHNDDPDTVAVLTYMLTPKEIKMINAASGVELPEGFSFNLNHNYANSFTIGIDVPERPFLSKLLKDTGLSAERAKELGAATTVKDLLALLEKADLNEGEEQFKKSVTDRFNGYLQRDWKNLLALEVWDKHLRPLVPQFLYFDDYFLLPGKVNLPELKRRIDEDDLEDSDKTVLGLLRMASVDIENLENESGYEHIKAQLEGLSNRITDGIFKFWKQNTELDVEFDIRTDPKDRAPYNSGANLYIRIRNRRHRVTVPFSQRSKGFIWFFSFLVWFDSVKEQHDTEADLILLLDEPGLNLHALAQKDFLRYIDKLAEDHQILYTTHSPFMINSDRLHQVRLVEDRVEEGTVITDNVEGSDSKTIFPLQAALGYSIAQNLFISPKNLLVEGPGDLIYLQYFSGVLESAGRTGLRGEVTIVPAGGLDKIATFIALLGGNDLEMAVLHDYNGKSDARLESMVRAKLIRERQVLNYAMFRTSAKKPKSGAKAAAALPGSDVEDLLSTDLYLSLFNAAFAKQLAGTVISETDLPLGDRIVERLERHLADKGITLRLSGGFNHYLVASHLASNPPAKIDDDTLDRFEAAFETINKLYK